ncbi:hypothetical protein [Arthrobacter antibioticus]|uniref:hypothetical protein n=1 Tax=Arthrobacter sp. H35-MC1 TaxID=3046203 RepID=UPI0024B8AE0C|nr:hypothetical protein [Arthrobacter sp. H35-MC1]MDJ0317393.1 hypothetical protein [Arthrobacter sp. H35-MC1]
MTHISKSQRWSRIAAWVVALAATISGLILLVVGSTTVWVPDLVSQDTYIGQTIQLGWIGLPILCVGLVSGMAVLIAEGYATARSQK